MAALAGVITSGFAHAAATGGWHMPASPALPAARGDWRAGAGDADYDVRLLGLLQHLFLGGEVRQPEKTIPRAILLSVLFVSAFYVAMNLAALPSVREAAGHADRSGGGRGVHLQLVAEIAQSAFGLWAGRLMAALIVWTAFASVFSLLLGYSRVPYAAARDGNYFRFLDNDSSAASHSAPVAGGAGTGGVGVLLFQPAAGDYDAGDYADSAAVSAAACGRDGAAGAKAGAGAAVSGCRCIRCRRWRRWRGSSSSW